MRDNNLVFVECTNSEHWRTLPATTSSFDLVIDALFGTGLGRPLEGLFSEVVRDLAITERFRETVFGKDRSYCRLIFLPALIPTALTYRPLSGS